MNLTVIDHPLSRHYLTVLRDQRTTSEQFRAASRHLTYTLIYEATARAPLSQSEITTPLEATIGYQMQGVVAIAVLRAGLGMLDAVIDLIPGVRVGFAGLQRDEETALPMEYYFKVPDLSDSTVLMLEPMLATGGSLSWAVAKTKGKGARDITALCVVAAPEGVRRMYEDHPDVRIVAAALDRELSPQFYIRPGLGDMGDRLFGTL